MFEVEQTRNAAISSIGPCISGNIAIASDGPGCKSFASTCCQLRVLTYSPGEKLYSTSVKP